MTVESPHQPHTVHEAVGADVGAGEAAAAIGLGIVALLIAGVLPDLLGALVDEHRLSASAIGLCGALEALTMGLSTALAGMLLKPVRLRLVGAVMTLVLAGLHAACLGLHETGILIARTLAGVPEGILLWITVGMIARSETPERWAGVLFTTSTAAQLVLALAFAFEVIPRFGADGGFAVLAIATIFGVFIAIKSPSSYAPLPGTEASGGTPPLRGWVALLATLIYAAAAAAVSLFLEPLAHQAGLSADVARNALWISLVAQIAGGATATALAGHVRYLTIFVGCAVVYLVTWLALALHPPAWAFVLCIAAGGFASVLSGPFLVPMVIEADPSRRAALQSAGAQLLASALGPLLAATVVSDNDVHGALILGAGLLVTGTIIIAGLHLAAMRDRVAFQRARA